MYIYATDGFPSNGRTVVILIEPNKDALYYVEDQNEIHYVEEVMKWDVDCDVPSPKGSVGYTAYLLNKELPHVYKMLKKHSYKFSVDYQIEFE